MIKYSEETAEKIKTAAREIFLEMGKDGARMQLIAERAGVNKALLHYYFRSKEKLYFAILKDILKEVLTTLVSIPETLPFKKFLRLFISNHIDFIVKNKNLLNFILWELRGNKEVIFDFVNEAAKELDFLPRTIIIRRIDTAVKNGEIKSIDPIHFTLNLVSLDIFPFVASPIISSLFDLSDEDMEKILSERKKEIFRLLWNDIKKE